MADKTIAFIGCGNMGRSLIRGLIAHGYPAALLRGADAEPAQRKYVEQDCGITVYAANEDAVRGADVVVVSVKPQSMKSTVLPLAAAFKNAHPLLLSVAAGIRIADLERWAGSSLAIVRVMPNTPALIGAGAAALCANRNTRAEEREFASTILHAVGTALWVENEALIDTVTALSGSGPAYFFYFMEIMERTGIELGLTPEQSRALTLQTALGAARMALETGRDPQALRQQVTSPGGTTEQAIKQMQTGDLEGLITRAMKAAYQRSQELAKQFGDDG